LRELSFAATAGVLATPNTLKLVASKRARQVAMLRDHPREWDRLIVTKRDIAPAHVWKSVDELFSLGAISAKQNVGVFEGWRFEWDIPPP
jgi:hypothetical protein